MNTRGVRRRFVAELTVSLSPLMLQKSIEFALWKEQVPRQKAKIAQPGETMMILVKRRKTHMLTFC